MYILRRKIGQPAGHFPWWIPWPCQGGREGVERARDKEREREREIGREISAMAFANVITGEIFELICTYLHFTGTKSVPSHQGLSKFFKIYHLMSFQRIFRSL